ncbi:DUF2202 domain-containing protein [Winogradskyella litoriviva]|uniref:DUF2202 domain-containing protein n=1 Tax=Winogradskyella litoriviva TaxID=1220182 RepID=A0ABX2E493_9FLAO|nr:DUF2202 domain-containing protein [Winogradskyella litoriviva]NRD22609.1 DUF2202 domain-containing protein [Winogradskyella litoriviva]
MKASQLFRVTSILVLIFSLTFFSACSDDNDDDTTNQTLSLEDKTALLYMLEEEKLARDTYIYLTDLWSINQFANIKDSEQAHMNMVEDLLIQNNIEYDIQPAGEFENQTLQNFYDQFVIDGAVSVANSMQIGATIEDVDIKDLQVYLDVTTHPDLIVVFESLQCGSRNHLRSFIQGIENGGNIYIPQFISQDEFDLIITSNQEQCN